ncbi:MAG: acyltransferase domain-containing protein [Asgard group archaeon]|nr:acyltransferase domain-containing protein [Asgard group archaeon]
MAIEKILENKKPIFAYNPPGIDNISLIKAVTDSNGIGLIDLDRLEQSLCETLLDKCQTELNNIWGIRVTNNNHVKLLQSKASKPNQVIVVLSDFPIKDKKITELKNTGFILVAEVISLAEAKRKTWADIYLIKGNEAAGRIGDETSFVLAQKFAKEKLSFIIQGGMGLYTSAAVIAIGAKAIVLDTQLFMTSECSLSKETKNFLKKIDATDTKIIGETTPNKYRVFAKLGTKIVKDILQKEKDWLNKSQKERSELLQQEINSNQLMYNGSSISTNLIPMGQDVAFAKEFASRFSSINEILEYLHTQIEKQITQAMSTFPFKENNDTAKHLGTRYPIVQGPMANISENPQFAKKVSDSGALPFLALGSLFKNQTRNLIKETSKILQKQPYGCGIIGLEANKVRRDEHLAILEELKPKFAVIAAGTIDQALQVKNWGIETFLHTPSPAIFSEAIKSGINHLVLEGMECGGHIGILTSFVLWELALYEINKIRKSLVSEKRKIYVAFAGGIAESISAAIVSIIASSFPDVISGILWVGSAYIFTKEIIKTKAIKPLYQKLALEAKKTVVLGESVNTRARAIPTPYAKIIVEREIKRLEQGVSLKDRKHLYEKDNLGATRIAALGEIWNPDGEDNKPNRFMPVDENIQYQKGNYLIGQITSNLESIITLEKLHNQLIKESEKIVKQKQIAPITDTKTRSVQEIMEEEIAITEYQGEGIAIIGLGCIFPDAPNINTFWQNIINKKSSIKEISEERWGDKISLFYNSDRNVPDKTYSKLAAYIENYQFNSMEYKIPPQVAKIIGSVQKYALVAAKEALADANLLGKNVDNSKTAVIVGNAMGDENRIKHTRRIYLPEVLSTIENTSSFNGINDDIWLKVRKDVLEEYERKLNPITEDSMPGELSNIIAGRIANTFNLRGKNMTTDAACASSLAALNVAVKGLLDKEYDIALCGGADCSLDVTTFVKFSKIGALSAEGSFPFDKRANGFVMGEGAGFIVLKRLSEAVKDGDKIYSVIRGLGSSSDGKGKGITAPNPLGQKLAIQRALDQSKIKFSDLQFVEAHGTSTTIGDIVELQVLNDVAKNIDKKSSIAIGSIKSQIGHLKSAAGIASLIKTILALHHKTLPPSINFETPNPTVDWENSPFYVNTENKNWVKPKDSTRKAGVSSFGFGGTNYHAILEEYIPGETIGVLPILLTSEELQRLQIDTQALTLTREDGEFETIFDENAWKKYLQLNSNLETESIFIGSKTKLGLKGEIERLREKIPNSSFHINGKGLRVRDFVRDTYSSISNPYRVGVTCKSFDNLREILPEVLSGLEDKNKRSILRNKGIFFSDDHKLGKIAFLFPGQGSQYIRMGKELWEKYEIVKETFKEGDEITQELMGFNISEAIFAMGKDDKEATEMLKQTEITQPAIFVVNIAIFRLLMKMGIKPDFVAGHSLGEYAALVASGILSMKDSLSAVIPRGKAMAMFSSKDKGIMASIGADYKTVDKVLEKIDGYVIAANKNSLKQTVISGATQAVKEAMKVFTDLGIQAIPLPVSAAFHSKIVAPAIDFLKESLEKLTYKKQLISITSNVTGEIYPNKREEIINLLCEQISSPVEWIKQITKMYEEDNVRTFIEIGPKYVLTSFTKGILEGKDDYIAIATNHPKKGAMQHLNEAIAALGAFGYKINFPDLKDETFYSSEFINPTRRFYQKKRIQKTDEQALTSISIQKSPLDEIVSDELREVILEDDFKEYLKLQAPAISAFLKIGYETYMQTFGNEIRKAKKIVRPTLTSEKIGITGISIGLPGKSRDVFDPNNFDDILAGENFIEKIPEEFREKMVDKNIVRLVKDAVNGAQFQSITDVSEVIKLAAQKGHFDLVKDYGVDADFTEILDITFQLAFAAGIEALRDAGIPLTPLKFKTSVGKEITKGWALPESLRDETGIVFASAFPAYSNLISIISDFLSDKYANKNKEEVLSLFDQLINQIKDKNAKEKIQHWFNKNKTQLSFEKETQFEFSRKFLFEILSMGHSQFAQFIRARGPNTQVNAACSSTTQAIAIGEDWIRTGRCKRVIIVAADDVTNEHMLEWIASGFLAVGAATTKENVEEAALPFDKRRHGMIIGMGAAGIILESESSIQERGIKPIVDLLGTHIVNSAFHGTRLDREHISSQMNLFISKIEQRYGISRDEIAKEMVFMSHETYTPARGGSASAEVDALRKTFGTLTDKIIIANTKGFTGHAMGAGIEDVVAVKILEKGIVPPVANWKEVDPELGYLNLSKGGPYKVKYALRFAAGFGSQLTLALFKLNTKSDRKASNEYEKWLNTIGGSRSTLEIENRTLRLQPDTSLILQKPKIELPKSTPAIVSNEFTKVVTELIVEKTGYPIDMIEPTMHLEEDLGIDTVKQAELFGLLRTKYDLPREEGVRIQDYYSVNKIAEYLSNRVNSTSTSTETSQDIKQPIVKAVLELIVEKTGYPTDMIEIDMELEEDLGIDTVKQAEMFGIIREKWNLPREEGIRIQDYSTVNKIADYILSRISDTSQKSTEVVTEAKTTITDEYVPAKRLILQLIEAPMPKTEKIKLKDKKFIVVGETSPFTNELISLLESKNAKLVKYLDLKILRSRDKILKEIPEEVIDGLIFIEPKTNQKNKHDLTARIFFSLCKDITYSESPLILTISNSGTSFGWNGKHAAISGSLTGLTKAIAREFQNSRVKCVSCLDPKLALDEICAGDGSIEVSYSEDGRRRIFITVESPIEITEQPFTITKDDLVLISGGALGITYEITKEIAKKYQPKLALLGIEKLVENVDEIVNYNQEKLAQLKEQLINDLKQKNERVTPVLIEKEWAKITKAVDIKKATKYLTELGCIVKYYTADVVNSELMKSTIEQIKADFEQDITGIIHGAGLEISKLVADKKPEEFDLVYNVKTIGLDNLIQNIDFKKVKFLKCFSSVAGRYGNAGQVDYSAANDYLSKNCWQLRSQGIRATSICWSAWGEVGMATRGSIMKVLKHVGVTPISVKDGVNAFINELEYGLEPEVVIIGKLGALMESPTNFVKVNKKLFPLIGKIKRNFDGSIIAEREFSLEDDIYLNHHRFDNIPYLPGVIGLEIFSELIKLAFPKTQLIGFNDVEFKSAIKFTNDKSRVLKSRVDYSSNNPECILISEFFKDGQKVGKPTLHFKANVTLGKRKEEMSKKPLLHKSQLADKKTIYSILPHGPLFQVLKEINDFKQEIITKVSIVDKNQFSFENNGFTSDPLIIESAFQTMGLLDIIKERKLGLPLGIKSLVINKAIEPAALIRGSKVRDSDLGSIYNFEILSKTGKVILKAEEYSTVHVDFGADLSHVHEIHMEQVKRLFDIPKEAILEVVNVDQIKNKVKTDPQYLDNFLHAEEMMNFESLSIEKRRYEWVAGVIAIKTALLKISPNIQLKEVKIEKNKLGKPFIQLKNKKPFYLSITHSNGFAVGIVDSCNNTGIDLEIKKKRDKSFVEELISSKEREFIKNQQQEINEELLTKIWTAKEAVSKVLGVGLNIDLHDLIISKIKDKEIVIKIDSSKIPVESHKFVSGYLKGKTELELKALINQNDEFVAAICHLPPN